RSEAYFASPLALCARRVSSAASRLLGSTSLRFALHGWQRAQRTNKAQRVRAIHAKIRNRRKDAIHKFTTHLAERYGVIFVGDVSSAKLVKTKMAKSVLDAGWHQLKTQLKYKAIARSGVFEEVNEAYSTQVCSCCGAKPDSSPKGRAGLGIRHWICSECGAEHDRDINAAKNILAAGGASPSRWRNPRPSGRVRMSRQQRRYPWRKTDARRTKTRL
ncbi:RNA-guided endonuclease InsQ/TnpB family protein, partial [Thiolapillus sp.]